VGGEGSYQLWLLQYHVVCYAFEKGQQGYMHLKKVSKGVCI